MMKLWQCFPKFERQAMQDSKKFCRVMDVYEVSCSWHFEREAMKLKYCHAGKLILEKKEA